MKRVLPLLPSAFFYLCVSLFSVLPVQAAETTPMGIHILHIGELTEAKELIKTDARPDAWQYVTVPFTLEDIEKEAEWQQFFDDSRELKVIPLVRLATRVENGAWIVPNRKQVVDQLEVLSRLNWPTDQKHVIIFNEVNHAKEWGGRIDPVEYTKVLRFATDWAHTEGNGFVVMGAAMDLAAPNGRDTKEAFAYLDAMQEADPDVFYKLDAWNSHSYPNPGFSSAPTRTGKNSLRGFTYELEYAKEKTGRDFDVYITETGWEDSSATSRWLTSYYEYALQHIWSDDRVKAVTPFVLKGSPGPFAGFSFVEPDGKPTRQYLAMRSALERVLQ